VVCCVRFISRGLMRPRSYNFTPLEGRGFACLLVLTARNTASVAIVGLVRGVPRAMLCRFAILPASAYVLLITGNDPMGVGG
jgi:hypothetical protein